LSASVASSNALLPVVRALAFDGAMVGGASAPPLSEDRWKAGSVVGVAMENPIWDGSKSPAVLLLS